MRKLHHMPVWITHDAQVAGIGIKKSRAKLQEECNSRFEENRERRDSNP
jgi:hypothetical protein